MRSKIKTLLDQLNHGLVEREDTLRTALLTVLAGENIVLIGPPGTGKSLIARRIAESFSHSSDNGYFEYLLTKFSTPEEIFGPLSITALKADRFKRNTAGYLPTVKIAFLDEIFKASSSILNALLTILNERIYHNGAEPQAVPLQALIAASNELPTNQEELNALYDRFLVRSFVDYVSQDNLPRLFEKTEAMPALDKLSATDLDNIRRAAELVTIPPEIAEAMQRIWAQHKESFKEDRRERLSDRRLKKVIKLLCVSAATNGRNQVDLSDVLLLKDCLWNHQENALKVRDLILNTLRTYSRPVSQTEIVAPFAIEKELMTYELADDGKTLIPVRSKESAVVAASSSALAKTGAKFNPVVKGYKGRGTAQDPLLIENFHDLVGLERPDVGSNGYCFRQTADIDCTELTSWMKIAFKGHYDGGGLTIKYKKTGGNWCELFSSIQAQSSVTNVKLKDLRLAATVEDSHIDHCVSTVDLVKENATDCTISACQAGDSLIGDTATNSTISACQAGDSLIRNTATNSAITDCLVLLNQKMRHSQYGGGIATTLTHGSVVQRCFVAGKINRSFAEPFAGIAATCTDSSIRQCAIGGIKNRHT